MLVLRQHCTMPGELADDFRFCQATKVESAYWFMLYIQSKVMRLYLSKRLHTAGPHILVLQKLPQQCLHEKRQQCRTL